MRSLLLSFIAFLRTVLFLVIHCLTTSSNLWLTIASTRLDLFVSLDTSYFPFLIKTLLKTVSSFLSSWNFGIRFLFFFNFDLSKCSEPGDSFNIISGPRTSNWLDVFPGDMSIFLVASKDRSPSSVILFSITLSFLATFRWVAGAVSSKVDLILCLLMELLLGSYFAWKSSKPSNL